MKQLLLVRVLTGYSCRYGKGNDPDLRKPPPLSQGSHVLYDTVTRYTNGLTVYVVYDHDRAYPAYLITINGQHFTLQRILSSLCISHNKLSTMIMIVVLQQCHNNINNIYDFDITL